MLPASRLALTGLFFCATTAMAGNVPFDATEDLASSQGAMISLVAHDHDHDGDADLYYARDNGSIVLRRQAANGSFSATTLYTTTDTIRQVIPATIRGSGKRPDLLVSVIGSSGGGGVRLLKNNGSDSFTSETVLWTNYNIEHIGAGVGDFNRDGRDDIVIYYESPGQSEEYLIVMCNMDQPSEYFEACYGDTFPLTRGNPSFEVYDFNRDGWQDFAVVGDNPSAGVLQVYRNNGASGTFGFNNLITSSTFRGATDLKSADLNLDGSPDLFAAIPAQNGVRVFTGRPRGATDPIGDVIFLPTNASGARAVDAADIDLDGDLDLVVAAESGNRSVWYENDRVGDTWIAHQLPATAASAPNGIVAADFDHDGDIDIISARSGSGKLQRERNIDLHQGIVFGEHTVVSSDHLSYGPLVIDSNDDGRNDIVASARLHGDGSTTYQDIFLQQSDATFSNVGRTVSLGHPQGSAVAMADINRDGLLDWAFAQFIYTGSQRLLQGTGGAPTLDGTWWGPSREALLIDVDHDGDTDFISNAPANGVLNLFRHTGTGAMYSASEYLGVQDVLDVVAADMDRDGWADLVISSRSSASSVPAQISWLRNNSGNFEAPQAWQTGGRTAGRIDVADMNNDGIPDVVASGSMLGGNGVTQGRPFWVSGAGAHAVTDIAGQDEPRPLLVDAQDADHDGDQDVLFTPGGSSATPVLYERTGASTFRRVALNGPETTQYGAKWGDVNGDGWPDMVWSAVGQGTRWAPAEHGQLGLLPELVVSPTPAGGVASVLLSIDALHLGRAGDAAGQLQTLRIELLDAADDSALSAAEVQAMWSALELWWDENGDGVFSINEASDHLLDSASLSSSSPQFTVNLSVAAAGSKTLYLVGRYSADAGSLPWQARLRLRSETAAAIHGTASTPLRLLPLSYLSPAIAVTSPNVPPVFTASGPFSVGTAAINGALVGDIQANDGNGGGNDIGITYSIVGGSGASLFSIDASGGRLRVASSSALMPGTVTVRVRAADAEAASETDVSILINPTRPPVFTSAGPFSLDEYAANNATVGNIDANNADGGGPDVGITYSIVSQSSPARFAVDAATGMLRLTNNTGLSQGQVFNLLVRADDGPTQSEQIVRVDVVDGNDPPIILNAGPYTTYLPAKSGDTVGDLAVVNGDGGGPDVGITYLKMGGTGEQYFDVHPASGVITHNGASGLRVGDYDLSVRAIDSPWSQNFTVVIHVEELLDPPVFIDYGPFSMPEDTPAGAVVGDINAVSRVGGAPDVGITYALQAEGSYRNFQIDVTDGRLSLADSAPLPVGSVLRLVVDATSGGGTTSQQVEVHVVAATHAPVFVRTGPFDVDEFAASGDVTGDVDANDGDGGGLDIGITYSVLSGTGVDLFTIDANGGRIRRTDHGNVQPGESYSLRVRALDTAGESSETDIQLDIVDGDDPPVFVASGPFSVHVGVGPNAPVGDIDAVDGDGGAADEHVTYAIAGGADAARFVIGSNDGQLTLVDSGGLVAGSTLSLQVAASDMRSTVLADVQVAVTASNAAPVLDQTGPYYAVLPLGNGDAVGEVHASDDGGVLSYSITGGSGVGVYAIDSATGVLRVANAAALTLGRIDTLDIDVSDGELNDTASIQITVVERLPQVFSSGFEDVATRP